MKMKKVFGSSDVALYGGRYCQLWCACYYTEHNRTSC